MNIPATYKWESMPLDTLLGMNWNNDNICGSAKEVAVELIKQIGMVKV
jgi:hypothetical protein